MWHMPCMDFQKLLEVSQKLVDKAQMAIGKGRKMIRLKSEDVKNELNLHDTIEEWGGEWRAKFAYI